MKKIKNGFKKITKNIKSGIKKAREEHVIREYIKNNILFLTFVITCVLNSTLLRFFCMNTIENYLSIKPIIADLAVVIIVGSFGYLLKPKNRFTYFLIFDFLNYYSPIHFF